MCAISIYMIFLHENIINFEKKKTDKNLCF